ncbi:MAG: hypothetical protein CL930_06025 [Deltaproteobacteria bacterium]|nr:hypothetical protein [Deltaproteobacteria bacterium]
MPVWLLPTLFAAAIAITITVVIEKLGGKKGGLLGSLPSTIVPATIGIYASAPNLDAFREAMYITPAGMLINGIFLYLWRVVPPRIPAFGTHVRLGICATINLIAWGVIAVLLVQIISILKTWEISLFTISIVVMVLLGGFGIFACLRNPPAPKGHNKVSLITLLFRGVLAGAAIGIAVLLSEHGGAMLAGIAAVFPAIFLTTMCALWISQGETVGAGAAGPMMLGGTSVSLFSILAAWAVPVLGVTIGCTLSWCVAVGTVTIPAWFWLNRRA